MSLADCVAKRNKLGMEDLLLVVNVDSQKDYMFLNYLEQEVSSHHGQSFFMESINKVQYIMGFILIKDYNGLFTMYSECFNIYMESCGNNIDYINGFNIVFLVFIHLAMKIIRRNKIDNETEA
jgi:hypothetical protein